jgi:hypothetical protein
MLKEIKAMLGEIGGDFVYFSDFRKKLSEHKFQEIKEKINSANVLISNAKKSDEYKQNVELTENTDALDRVTKSLEELLSKYKEDGRIV